MTTGYLTNQDWLPHWSRLLTHWSKFATSLVKTRYLTGQDWLSHWSRLASSLAKIRYLTSQDWLVLELIEPQPFFCGAYHAVSQTL